MREENEPQSFEKDFGELEFSDDIMFGIVMQNEKICKEVIKTLLNVEIEKIEYINRQQDIKVNLSSRGIRLDVFVKGSDRVFNVEMQTKVSQDLPKRARYYQSLLDLYSLKKKRDKGEMEAATKKGYLLLPESYVIFICKDDPFNFGIPVYTWRQICEELPEASEKMNDKTHRVFYNSSAWMKCEDKNLRAFLRYVYESESESDLTDEIDNEVKNLKYNDLLRSDYMTLQEWAEEQIDIIADKRADKLAEQRAEKLAEKLAEQRAEKLADKLAEQRAEKLADKLAEKLAEQRAAKLAEQLAEQKAKDKAIENARNFLNMGLSPEQVSQGTGLSLDEVTALQAETAE